MKLIINIPEEIYIEKKEDYIGDTLDRAIANGTPFEDIVEGIKSHKWGHNEGSKEIYNNAIDDVLTYIEEKLGE